mmetsp:Transcript_4229/g.9294  ORF Transcript_4229/g.9294 Transcript_4229/m.9294 type:complete len:111 (-) Transcript_4229:311-643(-)
MSSTKKSTKKSKRTPSSSSNSNTNNSTSTSRANNKSSGFLLTCDPPMKQFIIHLNDQKIVDKKFIIEDLDATHLLIRGDVRDEINRKVEEWMDANVYSTIERVGDNFDTS